MFSNNELVFPSLCCVSSLPQIREDIRYHGINIYPSAYGAEDDEDAAANGKIEVRMAACTAVAGLVLLYDVFGKTYTNITKEQDDIVI